MLGERWAFVKIKHVIESRDGPLLSQIHRRRSIPSEPLKIRSRCLCRHPRRTRWPGNPRALRLCSEGRHLLPEAHWRACTQRRDIHRSTRHHVRSRADFRPGDLCGTDAAGRTCGMGRVRAVISGCSSTPEHQRHFAAYTSRSSFVHSVGG